MELAGEYLAADTLLTALDGSQLLLSPWTALNVNALVAANRCDVVLEGLRLGEQARLRAGVSASSVLWLDAPPTPQTVTWLTRPLTGVTAFAVRLSGASAPTSISASVAEVANESASINPCPSVDPVAGSIDTNGGMHHAIFTDPFLEWLLSRTVDESALHQHGRAPQTNTADTADSADLELVIHQLLTELLRLARK